MLVRRLPAYPVYLLVTGFSGLFFTLSVTYSGAFQVRDAHLNPLQLVLVGTALEASAFAFEVPTGVVADVFSRRLSIIIGYALIGAGFLLWGAFPLFTTIVIANVVWGLGYTFTSGAQEAWISGEIGEERSGPAFLRGSQAAQVGGLCGLILSAPLIHFGLGFAIAAGGALTLVLAIALIVFMPETGFAPVPRGDRSSFQHLFHTLGLSLRSVRGSPVLITILAIAAIFGAASEGYDRLNVAHFLNDVGLPRLGDLDPYLWFNVMGGGSMALGLVGAEIVRRRLDTSSHRAVAGLLAVLNLALAAIVIAFGLSGNFALALGTFWALSLVRRTSVPLKTVWLNQNVEPALRATVFSLAGQADALGQILGGPFLGLIAAAFSVSAGFVVAGLFLAPALLLYARTLRRSRDGGRIADKVLAEPP